MLKYYLLAFAVVAIALFYAYVSDPCNKLVRLEFGNRHPNYQIVDTKADQGSPESVRCRVFYRKPDADQVHEEVWLYVNGQQGWEFSRVLPKQAQDQTP